MQTNPDAQKGAELLSRSFEALKTRIIEKLTNPKPPPPPPGPNGEDQLTSVYVVFDKLDYKDHRDNIRAIQRYLFEKGYEVILSAQEDDDQQISQFHNENLLECDATLIYYGLGNESWLTSKVSDFIRAVGLGRAKPILSKAIYVAAPETEHKQNLMTRRARLLQPCCYKGFCPELLDAFIDEIEKARS